MAFRSRKDATVKAWEISSGTLLFNLNQHNSWVYKAMILREGNSVLTASADSTVKLTGLKNNEIITLQHPAAVVNAKLAGDNSLFTFAKDAQFSTEGRFVYIRTGDSKVSVYTLPKFN